MSQNYSWNTICKLSTKRFLSRFYWILENQQKLNFNPKSNYSKVEKYFWHKFYQFFFYKDFENYGFHSSCLKKLAIFHLSGMINEKL